MRTAVADSRAGSDRLANRTSSIAGRRHVGRVAVTPAPGARPRVQILAATYVEVWWLAGCHRGEEPDVWRWIRGILDRRIADAHRATSRHLEGEPRPSRSELELADLLSQPIDRLWPV